MQQKLVNNLNMEGELRDFEQLGDQISAQIVKKLNIAGAHFDNPSPSAFQATYAGQEENFIKLQTPEINVYNNFQSSKPSIKSSVLSDSKQLSRRSKTKGVIESQNAPSSSSRDIKSSSQRRHKNSKAPMQLSTISRNSQQKTVNSSKGSRTKVQVKPKQEISSAQSNTRRDQKLLHPGGSTTHQKNQSQANKQAESQSNFMLVQRIIPSNHVQDRSSRRIRSPSASRAKARPCATTTS